MILNFIDVYLLDFFIGNFEFISILPMWKSFVSPMKQYISLYPCPSQMSIRMTPPPRVSYGCSAARGALVQRAENRVIADNSQGKIPIVYRFGNAIRREKNAKIF